MMDNAAFEIERKQRQENDAKDAIDIEVHLFSFYQNSP